MKLSQIKPNPSNPRTIRDDKFNKLVKSIQQFPAMMEKRPIVVDETMTVLGGNMRLRALQHIYGKSGDIPDNWATVAQGWTEEQKREFIIKDNAAFGEWDWDALAQDFNADDLADWGIDIPVPEDATEIPTGDVKDDGFDPEQPVETVCKKGDIWKLGDHRLMCGDSTDSGSVALLMEGEKADMCFTDPPYGVSYAEKNEYLNAISRGNCIQIPIENDHSSPSEMFEFWKGVFGIIGEFTKECMAYYITSPQGGELLLLLQAIQESETLALKHMLIWNKNNHVLGRCDYNYKHEPIIYGWKKKGTHHFVGGSKFKTSVWDIPKPQKSDLHPTMKPVELVSACLLDNSVAGQSVIDLFGGSGTTMIAAEQLNRRCYMMELDPHYCDVIIARWEKFTGRKAEKITDGMDV